MARSVAARRSSAVLISCLGLLVAAGVLAQEPSAAMKKADALYRAGTAALANNDLDTALDDLRQVVRLAPTSAEAHSVLGMILLRKGKVRESVPELEAALKLKPSDTAAAINLAEADEQLVQPEKELPLLAKAE